MSSEGEKEDYLLPGLNRNGRLIPPVVGFFFFLGNRTLAFAEDFFAFLGAFFEAGRCLPFCFDGLVPVSPPALAGFGRVDPGTGGTIFCIR